MKTINNQPKKIQVKDIHLDDEKIPRNLILMYDKTPYIQKAGLEWKANKLFGVNGYSVETEIITMDFEKNNFVVKGIFTDLTNGSKRTNFGHAYPGNANSMMQKNLLHLASTRAECRVLRMATACGYASVDEVLTINGDKKVGELPKGDEPATEEQKSTIINLSKENAYTLDYDLDKLTKQEAADKIAELLEGKK